MNQGNDNACPNCGRSLVIVDVVDQDIMYRQCTECGWHGEMIPGIEDFFDIFMESLQNAIWRID